MRIYCIQMYSSHILSPSLCLTSVFLQSNQLTLINAYDTNTSINISLSLHPKGIPTSVSLPFIQA
ncbi:hypothetical protein E2C01_001394 [Portunus trituberculatus]|uniref:Uncharacterized protein n=1 Tax=Portunus trituberculatus TaxID=210409 RepID=A0A5B7CGL0_PORTR|nr:hypothetical protein [Portunus trituberculatus]